MENCQLDSEIRIDNLFMLAQAMEVRNFLWESLGPECHSISEVYLYGTLDRIILTLTIKGTRT